MKRVLLVLLFSAVLSAAADLEVATDDLAWMAGSWIAELDGAVMEELWLEPNGGPLLGLNRTLVDGTAVAFELLRIERSENGLEYVASPGGRCPPTRFPLVAANGQRAVFENPAHDFPQRITYWRDAAGLHARIETLDGARSAEWSWSKADSYCVPLVR